MFHCEKCGREAGLAIVRCPRRKQGECPYDVSQTGLSPERRKPGLTLLLTGLAFLAICTYFPFLRSGPETSVTGVVIRTSLLSSCYLLGIFVMVYGFILSFSKKISIVSRREGNFAESFFVRNYEYSTRAITDLERVPVALPAPPDPIAPPSVIALAMQPDLAALLRMEKEASFAELGKLATAVADVMRGAILGLLQERLIEVRRGSAYESSGQRMELTSSSERCLLFPTAKAGQPGVLGELERRLLILVREWDKQALAVDEPLGPTLGLLYHACTQDKPEGELHPGAYLLSIAASDAEERQLLDRARNLAVPPEKRSELDRSHVALQSMRDTFTLNYPGLAEIFDSALDRALSGQEAEQNERLVALSERITPKNIRIGFVIAIILLVLVSRFSLPVRKAGDIANLISRLEDPSSEIRERALKELQKTRNMLEVRNLRKYASRTTAALVEMLEEERADEVKLEAIESLIKLETPEAREALLSHRSVLISTLRSNDSRVAARAALILGLMGPAATEAVPELEALAERGSGEAQRNALNALLKIRGEKAIQATPAATIGLPQPLNAGPN